jgi:hypothetical protein
MLDNVRTRLGDCRAQKPSDRQLLLLLSTELQAFLNELAISNRPWAVDEVQLVVTSGTEDYAVATGSNFGKPIRVRTVYPSNPSYISHDVEFFELTDTNFDWELPQNFGSLMYNIDGSPNTAMRMAFFRKSGLDQVYVRVVPVPQATATYQILYQVGVFGETAALADVPALPEHHQMIELRTALAALPMTEWYDESPLNSTTRKEFAAAISATLGRLEHDFNEYIKTTSGNRALGYRILPFAIN